MIHIFYHNDRHGTTNKQHYVEQVRARLELAGDDRREVGDARRGDESAVGAGLVNVGREGREERVDVLREVDAQRAEVLLALTVQLLKRAANDRGFRKEI